MNYNISCYHINCEIYYWMLFGEGVRIGGGVAIHYFVKAVDAPSLETATNLPAP